MKIFTYLHIAYNYNLYIVNYFIRIFNYYCLNDNYSLCKSDHEVLG